MYLKIGFCVFFLAYDVFGSECYDENYKFTEIEDKWSVKLNRNLMSMNDSWQPNFSKSLEDFYVVDRIPVTFLSQFRKNSDISLLFYSVPQDTEVSIITFVARELKINSVAGECPARDVEVHLKARSFPTVQPTNGSTPAGVLGGRAQHAVLLRSDAETTELRLEAPEPGEWYGVAFVSWTDPKLDPIEQQGLVIQCRTILYTDIRVKRAATSIIDCNQPMKFTLQNNGNNNTIDVYKCFLDHQETNQEMQMTIVSECPNCIWAVFRFEAKSLPSQDKANNIIDCSIDLSDVGALDFKFNINHFPNEWHYISIMYSKAGYVKLEEEPLKLCKDILKLGKVEEMKVTELIREKNTGYFSIDYNLPSNSIAAKPTSLDIYAETVETLKLIINPVVDIGGTLTMKLKMNQTVHLEDSRKLVVCIAQGKKVIPVETGYCDFNGISTNATIVLSSGEVGILEKMVHILYPDFGAWYVTFGLFCPNESADGTITRIKDNFAEVRLPMNPGIEIIDEHVMKDFAKVFKEGGSSCNAIVDVSIFSASCIRGSCGKYGQCNAFVFNGYLLSQCICFGGYSGMDCSDGTNAPPSSETLTAILCLTISNVLFIPSVYFAVRRAYYAEALVYLSTMFFSTFYHACDASDNINYGLCIVRMGVLQYCDFFCGLLSFWVTLVAMASLDKRIVSVLHIFGVVIIAFGTELDKLSVLVFVIPIVIASVIVFTAWGLRCRKTRALFPVKKYWLFFLPAGLVLVVIGLLCFTLLQTNSNYYIVHSIWHMTIALSIVCLLPTKLYFFPQKNLQSDSVSGDDTLYTVDENFNIL